MSALRWGPGLRLGAALGITALVTVCAAPAVAAPGVEVETLSTNTVDGVEYLVAKITVAPGSATGWHYHPGDVFGYIREGTLTHWDNSGGNGGCALIECVDFQPLEGDLLTGDARAQPGQEGQRLGRVDHQGRVEGALGDLGVVHHAPSLGSAFSSPESSASSSLALS